MAIAPEPFHEACLTVVYRAVLEARALAWEMASSGTDGRAEQIADLMDAIHNLPSLVRNWEGCDQQWLRGVLLAYDAKWGPEGGRLSQVYDEFVSGRI
jgi:hypothetical protein